MTGPSQPRLSPELISVIVPVLNEERHLGEQLDALAGQTYAGRWELVVVDNGCTDGSIGVALTRSAALPELQIVDARSKRGLSHARNAGAAAARGDFLAFCDADDVVTSGWLDALAKRATDAEIIGGALDFESLNDVLLKNWRPDVRDTELPVAHGFLPYAPGGNLGVWADVAREIRWDESFRYGSGDQEFGWRAQLAGHRIAFAPDAVVNLRYRDSLPSLARQWYAYGMSDPMLFRRFRELGMARPALREGLARWRWLLARAHRDLRSPGGRGNWIRVASLSLGRLTGCVRARVLVL